MTKQIMIRVSENDFSEIESLVESGFGRTKADFAKTAVILYIQEINRKRISTNSIKGAART